MNKQEQRPDEKYVFPSAEMVKEEEKRVEEMKPEEKDGRKAAGPAKDKG